MSSAKFNVLFSVLIFLYLCVISFGITDNPLFKCSTLGFETIHYRLSYLSYFFSIAFHLPTGSVFLGVYPWSWHFLHSFLRQSDLHQCIQLLTLLCMMIMSTPLSISNFTLEFPIVNSFTQCSLTHYVFNLLSISNLSTHPRKSTFSCILHLACLSPL